MKFSEIAILLVCITLSLTALSFFCVIPTTVDGEKGCIQDINNFENNAKFEVNDDGSITCDNGAITGDNPDTVCKVRFIQQSDYSTQGIAGDVSNAFGFSDIVRTVKIVGDVLYTSIIRADMIFDHFVDKTNVDGSPNDAYKVKFFFVVPLYLIYTLAFIEFISGRQTQNY